MQQLALFGDDQVVGTGLPAPWPTAAGLEPETHSEDPDQLTFDDAGVEAA